MQVLTSDIGAIVMRELRRAAEVQLAVAFFNPSPPVLAALSAVPKLTLVISEEFTINNPAKLEQLPKKSRVRSIPADSEDGKLHAKVLIVKRQDGSRWAMTGSANMTWHGLFSNQEACIGVDDVDAVETLAHWFAELLKIARKPDLKEAKRIFASRALYRLERRPKAKKSHAVRYWALKTTSGAYGRSHWGQFIAEDVVAIGWPSLGVDPSNVSSSDLHDEFPDLSSREADSAVSTIKRFIDLQIDDLILVCKGYSGGRKPVHIYGLARVDGGFHADPPSGDAWRFKHPAVIQEIGIDLPRNAVAKALGKQTLMQTLHELDKSAFDRICDLLRTEGVQPVV